VNSHLRLREESGAFHASLVSSVKVERSSPHQVFVRALNRVDPHRLEEIGRGIGHHGRLRRERARETPDRSDPRSNCWSSRSRAHARKTSSKGSAAIGSRSGAEKLALRSLALGGGVAVDRRVLACVRVVVFIRVVRLVFFADFQLFQIFDGWLQ